MFRHSTLTLVAALLVTSSAFAAPEVTSPPAEAPPPSPPAKPPGPSPYVESNVISLAGREGFRWKSVVGDFEFNPFVLLQVYLQGRYVDNQWLALTDQDKVTNLGFGANVALLGVAGRAFDKVTYNLTLNAACAGQPCLLQQASVDVNASEALRVRVGKFKTPAHWATQVRVGQTMLPRLPASLTTRVVGPVALNALDPTIATGFDWGLMVTGLIAQRFEYQVGVFNGEGINVNTPTSTMSDDIRWLPGLLYAARVAYTPFGPMPLQEGGDRRPDALRMILGASASVNVEANGESTNDVRSGIELALATRRLYWANEAYLLRMSYVERQRGTPPVTFLGAYTQLGYLFMNRIEPVVRLEVFDRNGTSTPGFLLVPAAGLSYYLFGQNLKLQAMGQGLIRLGYENDFAAHHDDNGLPDLTFTFQVQAAL